MVNPQRTQDVLELVPPLLRAVEATPAGMRTTLALDGLAAGGKTTIAFALRDHLARILGPGIADVVESDNYYSGAMTERCLAGRRLPADPSWPGDYFFDQFAEVLATARAGGPVQIVTQDWASQEDTGVLDLTGARIVIATGCGIISDLFKDIFDLTVWVECTEDEARRRGEARSAATGHPEHMLPGVGGLASWDHWMAADGRHILEDDPRGLASFLIDNGRVAAQVPL